MIIAPVAGGTTYTSILSTPTDGEIKARASGGAYCSADAADSTQLWSKIYEDGTRTVWAQNVDLGSYTKIRASLYTVLEAPGWFDHAYRSVNVYEGGYIIGGTLYSATWKQGWTTSTNSGWSGTQITSDWPIGTTGRWTFIVDVWGTDYGSQTCRQRGLFTVT